MSQSQAKRKREQKDAETAVDGHKRGRKDKVHLRSHALTHTPSHRARRLQRNHRRKAAKKVRAAAQRGSIGALPKRYRKHACAHNPHPPLSADCGRCTQHGHVGRPRGRRGQEGARKQEEGLCKDRSEERQETEAQHQGSLCCFRCILWLCSYSVRRAQPIYLKRKRMNLGKQRRKLSAAAR